jgi:hypothetical protein
MSGSPTPIEAGASRSHQRLPERQEDPNQRVARRLRVAWCCNLNWAEKKDHTLMTVLTLRVKGVDFKPHFCRYAKSGMDAAIGVTEVE